MNSPPGYEYWKYVEIIIYDNSGDQLSMPLTEMTHLVQTTSVGHLLRRFLAYGIICIEEPPAHADSLLPNFSTLNTFLRNVGSDKTYTAQHPRRRHSSV
jgi:hypothetical protein